MLMCVCVCVCVCVCACYYLCSFPPNPGTLGIRSIAEEGENGVEQALMIKADPSISQLRPGVRAHTLIFKTSTEPLNLTSKT